MKKAYQKANIKVVLLTDAVMGEWIEQSKDDTNESKHAVVDDFPVDNATGWDE